MLTVRSGRSNCRLSLRALSPVTARLPARIWLMRLAGTSICLAKLAGDTPLSSSSSLNTSPGCTALFNIVASTPSPTTCISWR